MNFRAQLSNFLDRNDVQRAIVVVIVVNAIILGLETSPTVMAWFGPLIIGIDRLCLAIFTLEILVKIYARGLNFFRDTPWNIFDFVIVSVAFIPSTNGLTALRGLRILRMLRLVSAIPEMRRVVDGFLRALPGMASVFSLMAIIFYISSVMATKLFASEFPDWFGSLGKSAYSLFQIMTLESWSMGIVRPVMETHPLAWIFFLPFILMTTFAVMNLVVGLIVNSMQDAHSAEEAVDTEAYRNEILLRLERIENRLREKEK